MIFSPCFVLFLSRSKFEYPKNAYSLFKKRNGTLIGPHFSYKALFLTGLFLWFPIEKSLKKIWIFSSKYDEIQWSEKNMAKTVEFEPK